MAHYIIFFNQGWVGDHPEEWFDSRGPLARAVVNRMKEAGVLVFAGGLDEDLDNAFHVDDTSGSLVVTSGPYVRTPEYLGGLTIIDVDSPEEARRWAGEVAIACGWPQEVREFKGWSD